MARARLVISAEQINSVSWVTDSGLPRPMWVGNTAEDVDPPVIGKSSGPHFDRQRYADGRVRSEWPEGSVRVKDAMQVKAAALRSRT
jgi:hypothetical protein